MRSGCCGAGRAWAGGAATAASRLAAYPSSSENAIASSPEAASTWNSCETSPPMAPEWARTARKVSPVRVKILV